MLSRSVRRTLAQSLSTSALYSSTATATAAAASTTPSTSASASSSSTQAAANRYDLSNAQGKEAERTISALPPFSRRKKLGSRRSSVQGKPKQAGENGSDSLSRLLSAHLEGLNQTKDSSSADKGKQAVRPRGGHKHGWPKHDEELGVIVKEPDSSQIAAFFSALAKGESVSVKKDTEYWNPPIGNDELTPRRTVSPTPKTKLSAKEQRNKQARRNPPHIILSKYEVEGMLISKEDPVLTDVPTTYSPPPIPTLAHGLDRVLFNPGIHWLQDPRSRVYNFTPWLESIPKVSEFDYDRIPRFTPSSQDEELWTLLKREKRRFAGSTSSLSGFLSHCYFLISQKTELDTSILSNAFSAQPKTFSPGQKLPVSVIFNYKDGAFTIDADKSVDDHQEKTILTWLGTLLEKFLTNPPESFSKLLRSAPLTPEMVKEKQEREAYRYSRSNDFIMRSQLDCQDVRLPGTGVFDIKTRACVPTRLDILNYEEHTGYTIKRQYGLYESFEREYYDLIRAAFLKYSFQARIGNMDGVIVAYHNTERLFGFQYVPLAEMDERLLGAGVESQTDAGDRMFKKCVGLMEKISQEIVACFGEQSVSVTLETRENTEGMHVWIQPVEWDGPEDQRPIEQLRVEATSYLGEDPVKGYRAALGATSDNPWTMHYKIQRLEIDLAKKRSKLEAARNKQKNAFLIPSHVDPNALENYWMSLSHDGKDSKSTFEPQLFSKAPQHIEQLRLMSRRSREEYEKQSELYEGQPKVVLGERY